MAEIQLFHLNGEVKELPKHTVPLEKELQVLIEKNMVSFFGVRFLQSEYTTSNSGRIDSLGLDENNCPVIFEYKRTTNEEVIIQGLFYLDWLMDHKADFRILVSRVLGEEVAQKIDWSIPRLVCVASGFSKYAEHAVNQIDRNIDLVRYIKFGKDLIAFEQLESKTVRPIREVKYIAESKKKYIDKTFEEQLESAPQHLQDIYQEISSYILELGEKDVTENRLKLYVAFKKMRNIVCAYINQSQITLFLTLNPDTVTIEPSFSRDMRGTGHWGTGDLEIIIKSDADFEKAKSLIDRAYEEN